MKQLIIYSHLNPASFTKAIVDRVEKVTTEKGDDVKIIDLYGDNFNPVLNVADTEYMFMGKNAPEDIKNYQDMITWADNITFVYPLWWSQMPAMLKGFIDRVMANGFAFEYTEKGPRGLLTGKTAQLYISTGAPNDYYEKVGMLDAQRKIYDEGIFAFCGIKSNTTFFGDVAQGTDELRKGYLDSIK